MPDKDVGVTDQDGELISPSPKIDSSDGGISDRHCCKIVTEVSARETVLCDKTECCSNAAPRKCSFSVRDMKSNRNKNANVKVFDKPTEDVKCSPPATELRTRVNEHSSHEASHASFTNSGRDAISINYPPEAARGSDSISLNYPVKSSRSSTGMSCSSDEDTVLNTDEDVTERVSTSDDGEFHISSLNPIPIFESPTLTEDNVSVKRKTESRKELREACGVFGCVLAEGDAPPRSVSLAKTIMDGLIALQHRGQESAGIVTSDGKGCEQFRHHRGLGLVSSVFTADKIATLKGTLGLGHTRYSTAGGGDINNAQPFLVHTRHGMLAIAHNGELINADTLRKTVLERGVGLSTKSDSELITQILSLTPLRGEHRGGADWQARIRHLMEATPTSYSLGLMNEDKIYGVRDPFGNRPLCVGLLRELDEEGISLANGEKSRVLGYVLSSESCAFTAVGATFLREVMPGEIVELSPRGVRRVDIVFRPQTVHSLRHLSLEEEQQTAANCAANEMQQLFTSNGTSEEDVEASTNGAAAFLNDIENVPPAFCIFEYVYFARPDSYFEGQQVYSVRQRCGRQLALESPVDVDIVSCVPESATPAARGYAMQLNLPHLEVLHKSRYVGRTFIQPCTTSRKRSVAHKFAAITENVRGKRVVLVDDSVVRGTTIRPIVKLIKDAGAKEVHFRVASPPIRNPCYMGINIPTRGELVANRVPFDQLAANFGVDSLEYLSIEGLVASVKEGAKAKGGEVVGHCTACLSGKYPVTKEW